MEDHGGGRRVTLELLRKSETIAGTLTDEQGGVRRFSGWLELIAALGQVSGRSAARRTGERGGDPS